MLSIGIGGGIGWVMLLNVWGVIWRIQKRMIQWTRDNATNGTPMPDKAKAHGAAGLPVLARQCLVVRGDAVLYGSGQPLSDVREVNSTRPTIPGRKEGRPRGRPESYEKLPLEIKP